MRTRRGTPFGASAALHATKVGRVTKAARAGPSIIAASAPDPALSSRKLAVKTPFLASEFEIVDREGDSNRYLIQIYRREQGAPIALEWMDLGDLKTSKTARSEARMKWAEVEAQRVMYHCRTKGRVYDKKKRRLLRHLRVHRDQIKPSKLGWVPGRRLARSAGLPPSGYVVARPVWSSRMTQSQQREIESGEVCYWSGDVAVRPTGLRDETAEAREARLNGEYFGETSNSSVNLSHTKYSL